MEGGGTKFLMIGGKYVLELAVEGEKFNIPGKEKPPPTTPRKETESVRARDVGHSQRGSCTTNTLKKR